MGLDLNDVLKDHGPDAIKASYDNAKIYDPSMAGGANGLESRQADETPPSNRGSKASYKFELVNYQAIATVLTGQWLIKRLLPAKGLAVIYGPPGCGKSFLALHAVLHIASGMEYAPGCAVRQSRVIYIAAEGQGRFGNRVVAAGKALDLPPTTPFQLLTVAPNLGREDGDAEVLIKDINAQSHSGSTPGLIVVDTLSRVMAGENENAEGMAAFIANASLIAESFDCLVVAVHHTGKDESRGMRGWSGLHGACDAEWQVSVEEGKHSVAVTKMKDGPDGWKWDFDLVQDEIGRDDDDEPVTTCTVKITKEPAVASTGAAGSGHEKKEKLTGAEIIFMDAFNEAMLSKVSTFRPGGDGPEIKAVHEQDVKKEFIKRYTTGEDEPGEKAEAARKAWTRARLSRRLFSLYGTENRDGVEWRWTLSQ